MEHGLHGRYNDRELEVTENVTDISDSFLNYS